MALHRIYERATDDLFQFMRKSLKNPLFKPYIISLIIGVLVCGAVLLLSSVLMFILQLPSDSGYAFGLAALAAGCFAAGYVLGRKKRSSGIKRGMLCAAAMFLLCLAGGIAFGSVSIGGFFGKLAVCVAAGVAGGVKGVNSRQ